MNKLNDIFRAIARSPFLWGILGAIGFYALLYGSPIELPLVERYFAGHAVEYMETVMFAVGLAALILKAFDIAAQRSGLGDNLLGPTTKTLAPADECAALLARLERLPAGRRHEYFAARLRAALNHVRRRGSADKLDDELKYLSDLDASRLHAGYALFRVIVWAIPILGFLGTVIGITMALNSVDLQAADQSMMKVLNGLGLKFDTTALALALSMVLMFVHFYVERAETNLLEQVDERVQEEFAGRFKTLTFGDGQLAGGTQMVAAMLQTVESLVQRQGEAWQAAVDVAGRHWAEMAQAAGAHLQHAASSATSDLTRHVEVLARAVEATGDVTRLEDALNRNLGALAGSKHFEQTVLSLAAAVNMLGAQLAESPKTAPVRLESSRRSVPHAA